MTTRLIYCCACVDKVQARLTTGAETYPHRADLRKTHYWKCDTCGNHVGCHGTSKRTAHPLGCIPTPALRRARLRIHEILDPIWKRGKMPRREVYKRVGDELGRKYHTGQIRSIEEAEMVYQIALRLARG